MLCGSFTAMPDDRQHAAEGWSQAVPMHRHVSFRNECSDFASCCARGLL